MAVMLMVAVTPAASGDFEADSSDSWVCTITLDGSSLTTMYSVGGKELKDTTAVKGFGTGKTEGSWEYDKQTGYGPFGSFYAAFDPGNSNKMVCHLNPYNLKEALGGGTSVQVDGKTVNISGCNIMWCLPKIYISTSGSTITLASDDSHGGKLAPAFTLKDDSDVSTSYNYLALGVYEATSDGNKLGSVSGEGPKDQLTLSGFRKQAKANEMVEGSVAQLWNFYQYQLYRLCSFAVMENFDSQGQVGYGNAGYTDYEGLSPYSQTGNMDSFGPYFGTADMNRNGAKLFIENAWGSLGEYVDDAVWWNDEGKGGLWAGQNVNPEYEWKEDVDETHYTSGKDLVYPYFVFGWGTDPSIKESCWGLPTKAENTKTDSRPDFIWGNGSGYPPVVGGVWNKAAGDGAHAGLSCISYDCSEEEGEEYSDSTGSRLAFLFTIDPVADVSVEYVDDGTVLKSDVVRKGQKYTISDSEPTKEGFTFVGWSDGTGLYDPGQEITVNEKHITLTAAWGHTVTYSIGEGSATAPTQDPVQEKQKFTAASYSGTRDTYTFGGWSWDGRTYQAGDEITMGTQDITLTAIWNPVKHKVTYILDGGSGTAPTQDDVQEKQKFTAASYSGTKDTFSFVGWSDGTTTHKPGDQVTMGTQDITLTAQWEPVKHTVTYSIGEGSATAPTQDPVQEKQKFTAASYSGTRDTYTFGGWSWDGRTYQAGDEITMGTQDITLTAVWGHTVTFDLKGGTWDYGDAIVAGEGTYTIPSEVPTKSGYTFGGWKYGDDTVLSGGTIELSSDITLTAVWGHTVTFDLKGGTWDYGDAIVAEEGTYTIPSEVPTKSGYTFGGWKYGDDTVLSGGTIELSSDMTLQVVWTSGFIPIIPDDGGDPIGAVINAKDRSRSGADGISILLIAIIVAIIAELAVLCISRKR